MNISVRSINIGRSQQDFSFDWYLCKKTVKNVRNQKSF